MSTEPASTPRTLRQRWLALSAAAAAFLAGCAAPLPPRAPEPPPPQMPLPPVVEVPAAPVLPDLKSYAKTHQDYRRDAAAHLYNANADRIYKGRLPPLLYAVGVLQVELDYMGNVLNLGWMRAPSHAPEVVAEIERTVRKAAPYPAAVHLGQVTYTDTWLWDRSGRFQLDTLTEGQLGEAAPTKAITASAPAPTRTRITKSGVRVATSSDCKKSGSSANC